MFSFLYLELWTLIIYIKDTKIDKKKYLYVDCA